ncbi:MAG: HDIG domain-containing protein [Ferruginibacter sp.]|nr:HDIG domain-containing protein [Chitinophagaceae bacterium]
MNRQEAQETVTEVFALYEQYGNDDYIGEPVSQMEHMCQAAQMAQAGGYDEEVILAAFFHDIGHLCEHIMTVGKMDGYGVRDHEILAGNYLRSKGFSGKIARLVESHVQAKRYLTYKYPDYYSKLSAASKITLDKQGGMMTAVEAQLFEQDDLHTLFIKLREWDDKAKLQHQPLPPLEKFREMALHHLLQQN